MFYINNHFVEMLNDLGLILIRNYLVKVGRIILSIKIDIAS